MNGPFIMLCTPRSGSTFLTLLLNQNQNMYVSRGSPLIELLWGGYKTLNSEHFAEEVLFTISGKENEYYRSIYQSFYKLITDKKYIMDRNINWCNLENLKMYEDIFGHKPKIIILTRDVSEIMTSWAYLYEKNSKRAEEAISDRIDILSDTVKRYREFLTYCDETNEYSFLHITYNDGMYEPVDTVNKIYDYLEVKRFEHDFLNVDNKTLKSKEVDNLWGFDNFLEFRSSLDKGRNLNSLQYFTSKQIEYFKSMNIRRQNV